MTALTLMLPGDPDTRTGGYIYDRRLARRLPSYGFAVTLTRLHDSFPFPDAAALSHAGACLAALPDAALVLVDGLALGAMPELAEAEQQRLRLVGLVHHPLAMESGLERTLARRLEDSERRALAATRHVIVTSAATAAILRERYAVVPERLTVAEPGTDPASPARGSGERRVNLLCVASLTPRKGHDLLLDALAPLRDHPWRLVCVGSPDRDPAYAARLQERARRNGLAERVQFTGELDGDRLEEHYDAADVFVLPTRLEGYGMALAEAIARGLPVITSAGGAAEQTVGRTTALLVAVDDEQALTDALARVIEEPALRRELAAAARRRAAVLPGWSDTARAVAQALSSLPAR